MKPTKKMHMRVYIILFLVVIIGFGTVFGSLVNIQIFKGKEYRDLASEQQLRDTVINPTRGDITDRNGNVLATSNTVWNVILSPNDIKDDAQRELIASGLSAILEVEKDEILEKSHKSNFHEYLKKKVDKETVDKVLQFASDNKIGAIYTAEDTKRYYPYGNFCSTVLGFVGSDNQGLAGVESYYDKFLTGTPGRVVSAKNARGTEMDFEYEKIYDAVQGNTVVLTIDEVIQHYLEKYLQEAVDEHHASERGGGIVMNVKTGEILAMATKPDFDPNEPMELYDPAAQERVANLEGDELKTALANERSRQWRNKVLNDLYEPGSVFKPITASAALEEGVVDQNSSFYCPGYYMVAGRMIKCASYAKGGHGQQNFMEIMKNSCNPGFMMTAEKLGAEKFATYFKAFGFTEKTGIDLPGEVQSIYHETFSAVDLASSSFGQTNSVTPLQMATAMCAVVNGGHLYQPHVVKQIQDKDGNVVENYEPTEVRQVISESTSKQIAEIMEHVIADPNASGKNAYVKGFRIGGKSGTSQKLSSGQESSYVASFLAFAPVDDPQILVLMFLDEAHSYSIYGSSLVAPSVGKLMADILPYIGIDPQYEEGDAAAMVSAPKVTDKTVEAAETDLRAKGFKYNKVGNGDSVVKQYPAAGTAIPAGSTITLYTEEDAEQTMTRVPNLVGMSASTVNQVATNAKINIKFSGGGSDNTGSVSVAQSVAEGEEVPIGTVVTVELRDKTVSDDTGD